MKSFSLVLAAGAALSIASSAHAVTVTEFHPGDPEFTVEGNIWDGPISADFGRSGLAAGDYIDRYLFTIPQTGFGNGSVTTSTNIKNGTGDLDFTSVTVNGKASTDFFTNDFGETYWVFDVPIVFGVENVIEIAYKSWGDASYGGQANFVPTAVPELGTWAMMLLGVGFAGFAMRRNRRVTTRLAYS